MSLSRLSRGAPAPRPVDPAYLAQQVAEVEIGLEVGGVDRELLAERVFGSGPVTALVVHEAHAPEEVGQGQVGILRSRQLQLLARLHPLPPLLQHRRQQDVRLGRVIAEDRIQHLLGLVGAAQLEQRGAQQGRDALDVGMACGEGAEEIDHLLVLTHLRLAACQEQGRLGAVRKALHELGGFFGRLFQLPGFLEPA